MGSSSNPMQQHHKKQRKKEKIKNVQQRAQQRDERVLETKTVQSVKDEIKKYERRKGHLQPTEQQKLQRLQKELKMLQEAEIEAKKKAQQQQQQYELDNRYVQKRDNRQELDDPRKSVYYDERFNPYGAPPPGKPRLYHQRGGGVTMDIRFAVVPGQEEEPLPIPPPPPLPKQSQSQRQERQDHRNNPPPPSRLSDDKSSKDKEQAKEEDSEKQQHQEQKQQPREEESKEAIQQQQQQQQQKPKVVDANAVPSLPPPSEAVQRAQRRRRNQEGGGIMADIWASNEEVEYERQVNQIDLEADDWGTNSIKKKKNKKDKKKKLPIQFHYQDRSGQVQGPFDKQQMKGWIDAGYFPSDTLIKTNRKDEWVPIDDVPAFQEQQQVNPNKDTTEQSIEDRIAALRNQNDDHDNDDNDEEGVSLQARIAALKGNSQPQESSADQANDGKEEEDGIQARIAALRGNGPASIQQNQPNSSMEESGDVPYVMAEGDADGVAPYPVDVDDEDDIEAGVAPYPVDDNDEEAGGVAPYQIDEDDADGVAAYPVDDQDDSMAAYPVDADDVDVAYPVDEPYPGGEDLAYPVTDAYPVGDEDGAVGDNGLAYDASVPGSYPTTEGVDVPPPKKTIKVDKALVAFLPSHLQNKKRKAVDPSSSTKTHTNAKKKTKPTPETTVVGKAEANGTDDDYDKFMEEIDGL